jgi:LacI family transcriptional regulator
VSTPSRPLPRKVTRRDVARLAGVSDAVVSYTLNGGAPVAEATARRVLDAVAELGYSPNRAAQALRSGLTQTLVLVVPDVADPIFANPFFSEYASRIETQAAQRGYALYSTASSFEPTQLLARFREFAGRQVSGVMVLSGAETLDHHALDSVGLPWLELNCGTPHEGVDTLTTDLRSGAELAVRHLFEHGHRSVGFVGEDSAGEPRYQGWQAACATAALTPGPFFQADLTRTGGYDAGTRIAATTARPDALFVASDRTAVAMLRALHENGVRIPEDIALIACDGTWEGEYSWPSLSTVRQPIEEMSAYAVERVLDRSAHPRAHREFQGRLVLRESCGSH